MTTNIKYNKIDASPKIYENIVNSIRGLIETGELKKGERLPSERKLSDQFGVSRTAVREAIKSLNEIGVLDVQVGRGTFVSKDASTKLIDKMGLLMMMESVNTSDLHEVRQVLEIPIIRLAALNRKQKNIENLEQLLEEMKKNIDKPEVFIKADTNFHLELARATQHTVFYILINTIVTILQNAREFILQFDKEEYKKAIFYHGEILRYVTNEDSDGAELSMKAHLKHVGDTLEMTSKK